MMDGYHDCNAGWWIAIVLADFLATLGGKVTQKMSVNELRAALALNERWAPGVPTLFR